MLQQGGIHSAEVEATEDQETSTAAFKTGCLVASSCTSTLTSTGPARSGTGEAKTVMSRPLRDCRATMAPPSARQKPTARRRQAMALSAFMIPAPCHEIPRPQRESGDWLEDLSSAALGRGPDTPADGTLGGIYRTPMPTERASHAHRPVCGETECNKAGQIEKKDK